LSIPLNDRNTAHKAARLFLDAAGIDAGVRIFLEKPYRPKLAWLAGALMLQPSFTASTNYAAVRFP